MKQLLKQLYYQLTPKELKDYNLDLGVIFHTEVIFDKPLFDKLIKWCVDYTEITGGAMAICTIMSGVNPRIAKGIKDAGISMDEFVARVRALEKVATLGYHGHFHVNIEGDQWKDPENEIHCNNYVDSVVIEQMKADLDWFKEYNIDHKGIYAPGWFFMNEYLLGHLLENGFHTDYSFSYAKWFRNEYSNCLMHSNGIQTGESFEIKKDGKIMTCVQNLIGTHNSPVMRDFDRNLGEICSPKNKNIIGVLSVHDDDVDHENALKGVEYLIKTYGAKFHSNDELVIRSKDIGMKTIDSKLSVKIN